MFKGDKEKIEQVSAAQSYKNNPTTSWKSYSNRLRVPKISTLYYRRAKGDMVECCKYLHGRYQVAGNLLERDQDSRQEGTVGFENKQNNQHRRPAAKNSSW